MNRSQHRQCERARVASWAFACGRLYRFSFCEGKVIQTEREKFCCREREKIMSRSSPAAEAADYMLRRWVGFTTFSMTAACA